MGNVLSYSGLTTKARAMQSKLLTEKQLEEIVRLPSIPSVASYLKRTAEYWDELEDIDETLLHRTELENQIKKSIFQNFSKLYHFANPEQRKFLDLYGKRYEIRVLKDLITNIFDHTRTEFTDLTPYEVFFYEHSRLDLKKLSECRTIEELISSLKGNEFHLPLSIIAVREKALPFDYSMALDLYYFSKIWKVRKKLFKSEDLKEITRAFGEQFDLLNLQFIRRARRYSNLTPEKINEMLIPINYRLKSQEIHAMLGAGTPDEAERIFKSTYYGKKYLQSEITDLEDFYAYLLRTTLTRQAHKNPYSAATLFSYLYLKEREVTQLTIAIECVSYGTPPDQAIKYIRNT